MRINNILNIDDYYFDVFMSISATLTGHSVNELQSTGQSEAYYTHILNSLESATFVEFLRTSKSILESSFNENQLNNTIAEKLIAASEMKEITDKVITLWYLGSWHGAYISASSYTEGLVWKVMGSHPPGAKQPGFKSWNVQPINA